MTISRRSMLALAIVAFVLLVGRWLWIGLLVPWQDLACCRNNLGMIALMLNNYHDLHGTFPPAYQADSEGRPAHSWRTLLLPMYDRRALVGYSLADPWDGPENEGFTKGRRPVYKCPVADQLNALPTTNYAMVIGSGTISTGVTSTAREDFTDGLENTIVVIEVFPSDTRWAEPRDLSIDEAVAILVRGPVAASKWSAPHHLLVLFADGAVIRVKRPIPSEVAQTLFTIAGGEATVRDELIDRGFLGWP